MDKDNGGSAFPVVDPHNGVSVTGMTLRDYFAAAAMNAVLIVDSNDRLSHEQVAASAYRQADAMLAERAK